MTDAQTEARAIARLRETLGGIYPDDLRGDNLAVFLASEIEPQIEDETLDKSGTWKQGAIDACDRVLDAIHAHYATALEAQAAELEALIKRSKDRVAAMTPHERRVMHEAQRQSWARGMARCEHGIADFEECPDCRALAQEERRE